MIPVRVGLLNMETLLKEELPLMLLFCAGYNSNSQRAKGYLAEIGEALDKKLLVGYVDIDYCPDIFYDYDVFEIPTVIMFECGKPIMRHEGYIDPYKMRALVRKFYGVLPDVSDFKLDPRSDLWLIMPDDL